MSSIVKIAPSASIVYQCLVFLCNWSICLCHSSLYLCARLGDLIQPKNCEISGNIYSVKCQFRGSLKGGNATFFTVFSLLQGGLSTLENWGENKGYLSSQRSPGESPDIQCFAEFDASQRNFKFAQVVKSNSNSPLTTSRKV